MPSRHSYVARSSRMAPLSEIIKLEPEEEPWCAGHAASQGRRCHARTNARGRSTAMMLLHEGTKDLRAGLCIDDLLEDLAPHVLCTRFHQNQASGLARRWKDQVRAYLDAQVAPRRPRARRSRTPDLETHAASMTLEEMTARLEYLTRRLEERDRPVTASSSPSSRESRRASSVFSSSSVRRATSRTTATTTTIPFDHVVMTTARRHSTESTDQSATSVPRPAQTQASRQTRPASVSSPRPATQPTRASSSSRTGDQDSQDETPRVTRREVEGDCGICLCQLRHPHRDVDTDEEEESAHGGEDVHDDDDDDDDDEEEDEPQAELVWCKARCGVNFHKDCIDQWLATDHAPTCPACRSIWRR